MVVQSYQEAIDYLYRNLPMFQRVGKIAFKPDLKNTEELCRLLDHPERKFKSIHVGGTNGKGSTSHMLASILQSSGYTAGLYTSPHLKDFTERIRVNGEPVEKEYVLAFVNRMHEHIQAIKPSFFEITVAMAFDYFVQKKVDVAVVEVGLGGRLDSTNVINPIFSLITNIGWDHKDILGDTLQKIAWEKAGIIKGKTPVIVSERQENVQDVFISRASELGAPIEFSSDSYEAVQSKSGNRTAYLIRKSGEILVEGIELPLEGTYQEKNIAGVFSAVDLLKKKGFKIDEDQIRHGLANVISQTKLKGRWQKLGDRPMIVCDTGHNIDGVEAVLRQVRQQEFSRLHIVWGMVRDKDIADILNILPKDALYYFCNARIPRAMDAGELAIKAGEAGLKGLVVPDVNQAIQKALSQASADDFILVGGSTFVVGEIEGL
jgi:dihydrofolate synthase / folylpolyglutamate synthase